MDTKALEVMDAFTMFEAVKKGEIDYKDFDWWVEHVIDRAYERGHYDCDYSHSMDYMVDPDSGFVK
jgi:hypothetical protein